MSYDGELTAVEREAIVAYINRKLDPLADREAQSLWADVLKEAFDSVGRQLVFLDAGQQPKFYVYSPAGAFFPFRQLELESLLFDCGDRTKLRQANVNAIVRAVKARAGVTEAYFEPGERCLVCADVTLVFDWDHPEIIRTEHHSPEFRARGCVPIPFLSTAGDDQLHRFLDETFGDDIAVKRLTEQVGLALFGEGTLLQRVFILHGDGLNSKGTIAKLFKSLFPRGQVTSVPPKDIPPEWGRAQLQGSRMNLVNELDRLSGEDVTALKTVVTGEEISARNSKERGFTLEPKAFHLIATNNPPFLGKKTRALARRFVMIRLRSDPLRRQDPLFERGLLANIPSALLNLCVENARQAALRLKAGDVEYELSPAMLLETEKLFGVDHIEEFAQRYLIRSDDFSSDRIRSEEVRHAYENHCAETRNAPASKASLNQRLKELGFPSQKVGGQGLMHVVGAKWRDGEGGEGGTHLYPQKT